MNVLMINGSPKGGRSNTLKLSNAFVDGIRTNVDTSVHEIIVNRMNIKHCLGCFSCWNKTPGKCCIQDDMSEIIQDLLWADVVIWSFPLYYFSVPGPLKNLIDRQLPMSLPFMTKDSENGGHPSRYDMSGKRHVVISTCGFFTAQGNYDGVNSIFNHMCGKGNYTSIYCAQGELFRVPELHDRTDEYLSWVKDAGREFSDGSISRETTEKLNQMLFPRSVFEAMADASWGVEKNGEKTDETLTFTRQMAALYNKSAYSGKDIILEMYYTDEEKRYQILLGKDDSQVLTENFRTPTTVIETPYTLWKAIAAGEISGQDALMQQKYRVTGDFNLMIYWGKYFGGQEGSDPKPKNAQKPTNMMLLLLPWIVFWIATASMDVFLASLVSIAVSVLAPLVFFRNRMLLFDHISTACISLLSVLLLANVSLQTVLPLSYLGFGVLWTLNGFTKIPLTAHYSVNNYGGDEMLTNPLFIKTNRILTLCWGGLYLLMTIWTAFLMRNGAEWIAIANSLLLLLMSFFTVWFQKWYPAHVARGK